MVTPTAVEGQNQFGADEQQGRAGIIRGFLPAVVTVAFNSPAYKAGMRTGQKIKAVVKN